MPDFSPKLPDTIEAAPRQERGSPQLPAKTDKHDC